MAGLQEGMQLGQKAFADGGQVQGYASGGAVRGFATGGDVTDRYYDDGSTVWDLWTTDPSLIDFNGAGEYLATEPVYNTIAPDPYWGPAVADPDTAFTAPLATTQPVSSTGAVSGEPQTIQDWYDLGLMVEGGGNMQVPTIRKSDFAYYEAQGEPTIQVQMGGGDSGTWMETQTNPNYRPAGYYMTPEAQARLGEQWTKDNNTSIAWGGQTDLGGVFGGDSMGDSFSSYWRYTGGAEGAPPGLTTNFDGELGYWSGNGDNPTWTPWSPASVDRAALDSGFEEWWNGLSSGVTANVKTADKGGTPVQWVMQGDELVPVSIGSQFEVNTNNDWTVPAASFAALGAIGYAAPYLMGEVAAGAGAGAGATSAAEAFALSDAVYGAANLGYTAAELAALGVPAADLAAMGYSATEIAAATGEVIGSTLPVSQVLEPIVITGAAPSVIAPEVIAGTVAAGGAVASGLPGEVPSFDPIEINPTPEPPPPAPEVPPVPPYVPPYEEVPNWPQDGPSDVPYTPEDPGPYAPGENPTPVNNPSGPLPTPLTAEEIAKKIADWALKNPGAVLTGVGMLGGALENPEDATGGGGGAEGWNGPVTDYAVGRTYTAAPAGYRPGFSPEHQYVDYMFMPTSGANAGVPVGGSPGATPPNPGMDIPPLPPPTFAAGGIASLTNGKGGVTKGPGDGTSDSIPASIDGQQEAALSTDEFVVPADVVSDLGNGSSEAGAQVLYAMMDRVRQARHGTTQQPRDIDPGKLLPA
jgi:hypothetical protein